MNKLSVQGQKIVDESGNQVILSGINFVCKDKELGYVTQCDETLFDWFEQQGFNLLRLGLIWDGVEPLPGKYNDNYLHKIAEQIEWANKHNIYVYLDMHQDLYSYLYSDGAPPWATLNDDLPHTVGESWSEAYLQSEAVQRSLDNFWANKVTNDGVGLLEHYANMWAHVVCFFNQFSFNNLIGYDIMNEPPMGSQSKEVIPTLTDVFSRDKQIEVDWFDSSDKVNMFTYIADIEEYKPLINSIYPISSTFEREVLNPFFKRVAKSIRAYDTSGILLFEPNYFCNTGVESNINAITDDEGVIDSQQIFAPHGYDLVVDTDMYSSYNQDRVDFIFDMHRKTQQRLNCPVLIGEWGAFSSNPVTYQLSIAMIRIFERYLWSDTYWCYCKGMENTPYMKALKRGYPMSVSGELKSYYYDYEAKSLSISFYTSSPWKAVLYHPYPDNLTIFINEINSNGNLKHHPNSCEKITITGENTGIVNLKLVQSI